MHNLLKEIFKKRGIKDVSELSADEAQTFENWNLKLIAENLKIEDIEKFCKEQLEVIQTLYTNPENSDKRDIYLKACLMIYGSLIKIIQSPAAEREALEKKLRQLLQ